MGRLYLWGDLSLIKSNRRVKLEIKEGGKTPWNSIYVTEHCESEIALSKRIFRREIKSRRVEGDIVVVEELPADGFRELKDGGGRLLFENQNKLIPVEDFCFFSDWDAIGINFAEISLRWQVTNLIQFSICLSVLGFVTTGGRVNLCRLYKFFKKITHFLAKLHNIYFQRVWGVVLHWTVENLHTQFNYNKRLLKLLNLMHVPPLPLINDVICMWAAPYYGFSSNWILLYFPLSVCSSQAWHLTYLTYKGINAMSGDPSNPTYSESKSS